MTFHSEAVHQYQLLKGSPHKDTYASLWWRCIYYISQQICIYYWNLDSTFNWM